MFFFNNHVYGAVVVWFTPGLRRCSYNSDRSMRTSPDFRACVQHVSSLGFKTLLGQWEYHLLAMSHQLSWDVDAGSNDVAKLRPYQSHANFRKHAGTHSNAISIASFRAMGKCQWLTCLTCMHWHGRHRRQGWLGLIGAVCGADLLHAGRVRIDMNKNKHGSGSCGQQAPRLGLTFWWRLVWPRAEEIQASAHQKSANAKE